MKTKQRYKCLQENNQTSQKEIKENNRLYNTRQINKSIKQNQDMKILRYKLEKQK